MTIIRSENSRSTRDHVGAVPAERELLRTIVDAIPAMLAYWDSTQRCRFANRAYERWFGVSPESLIGKHASELLGKLYPLNRPYIEAALRGEPQEFEREIPDPFGGPPRHSLASYIPDVVDGVVRGFFVLVTDISAIKRAERALRDSEERFARALKGADLASWDWNVTTGEAVLSPRWATMRGFSPEEVEPHVDSWISGVHPDDRQEVENALAAHFQGRTPEYATEHRVRTKSGEWLWVLDRGKVFARDEQGRPTRMAGTELDITEQKRIEHDQRFLAEVGPALAGTLDYEETLSTIAELAVRDLADLCIVDVVEDDREIRRLKVASRDPSKAWLCELLAGIELDRSRPHLLWSVLETKEPFVLQHPSAETIAWLAQSEAHHRALVAADIASVLAVPLVARGSLLGAIAFLSSTPSRVYGPPDVRLAEELAQRAALSIMNARLYRTARRATRARDELLGIVAHDLRNPLNNIVVQADLLRLRGEAGGGAQHAAEGIARAATRMSRLIQDLLDVTSLEAGQLSVDAVPVAARDIVTDAAEAQEALTTSASLELRLEPATDLPEILADRDRLLQVFENLIGNAVKFTEPGGRITVGAAPREGHVLFWVRDTGCGIAPEHLPHLFDRFWQGGKAERRGAGLGLPIVRGIIAGHRGRIWVESTPGEGSTFYFTIPSGRS